jgi:hypothetical protein
MGNDVIQNGFAAALVMLLFAGATPVKADTAQAGQPVVQVSAPVGAAAAAAQADRR